MGNNQSPRYLSYQSQPQYEEPTLIIHPYLYLGGANINNNPRMSKYLGITHILNMASELTPNMELFGDRNIKYKHIPADDSLNYNMRYHFEEAFELIDDARQTNGRILVHCAMGISRSATIVIAYLMSRYNLTLKTAYDFVKSRRSIVAPNQLFMNLLKEYDNELNVIHNNSSQRPRQYMTMGPYYQQNRMSVNSSGSFNKSIRSFAL